MNSKLSVFGLGVTSLLGVSLLTACGDRMGSMKSRRVSCQEYNEFAVANKLDTVCDAKLNKVVKAGAQTDKNSEAVVTEGESSEVTETPKDLQGNGKAFSKEIKGEDGQVKALEAGAAPKSEFLNEFNGFMQKESASAAEMVRGINIISSNKNGVAVVDVEAVIRFKGGLAYLKTVPGEQAVHFDADKVTPMKIEVRRKIEGQPEVLADEVLVFATCLKEEPVCSEMAILIDFDASSEKLVNNDGNTHIKAVFQVKTGQPVVASNLGNKLKSFEEGQKELIAQEAESVKVQVEQAENGGASAAAAAPKLSELWQGAQGSASVISRKAFEAADAASAATIAKQSGQTEEADKQALAAEKAAAAAEEAYTMLAKIVEDIKTASPSAPSDQKVATLEDILKDSADRLEDVKKSAALARAEANTAKQLADKATQENSTATASGN